MSLGSKLPTVMPTAKCKLRLLKLERVKDWLLMEEEFVTNQERLKPQEERNQEDRTKVRVARVTVVLLLTRKCAPANWVISYRPTDINPLSHFEQVDDLRGSPLSVGTLEELVDEK